MCYLFLFEQLLFQWQFTGQMNTSILTPERRIENNPYDVDAWNILLRESQVRIFRFTFLLEFLH